MSSWLARMRAPGSDRPSSEKATWPLTVLVAGRSTSSPTSMVSSDLSDMAVAGEVTNSRLRACKV